MNLNKIDTTLCLAFNASEGPYNIVIKFDGGIEETELSREEINVLSTQELVNSIEMSNRLISRRWIGRTNLNERRNK